MEPLLTKYNHFDQIETNVSIYHAFAGIKPILPNWNRFVQ